MGEDYRDLRAGIDAIISAIEPDYVPINLVSLTLAFSGWGCTSYGVRGLTGFTLYTAPSIRVTDGVTNDDTSPLPGVEVAQFNIVGVAANSSNVWYRDKFTIGSDTEKLEEKEVQLDYVFWIGPQIGDDGVEHEVDDAVRMWLVCYKFSIADCPALPQTADFTWGAITPNASVQSINDNHWGYTRTNWFDNRVWVGPFHFGESGDISGRLTITLTVIDFPPDGLSVHLQDMAFNDLGGFYIIDTNSTLNPTIPNAIDYSVTWSVESVVTAQTCYQLLFNKDIDGGHNGWTPAIIEVSYS
jgi:hypothetical protein